MSEDKTEFDYSMVIDFRCNMLDDAEDLQEILRLAISNAINNHLGLELKNLGLNLPEEEASLARKLNSDWLVYGGSIFVA